MNLSVHSWFRQRLDAKYDVIHNTYNCRQSRVSEKYYLGCYHEHGDCLWTYEYGLFSIYIVFFTL